MYKISCVVVTLMITGGVAVAQTNDTINQGGNFRNSSEGTSDAKTDNAGVVRPDGAQRSVDIWTEDRMRGAAPMNLPKVDPNSVRRQSRN